MRILVDGQALQTDSRIRGIGRYAEGLINGLCVNGAEVIVLLNGTFEPRCSEAIHQLTQVAPSAKVEEFFSLQNFNSTNINTLEYFLSQELYFEAVKRIEPDIFLCPSSFEVGQFFILPPLERISTQYPVATICHDLIPLEDFEKYLSPKADKECYLSIFRSFLSSDLVLCNSKFSELQLLRVCPGVDTEVIWGASFNENISAINKQNYIFYCGGLDERKNVEFLCRSYAKLPYELRSKHPLHICCRKNSNQAKHLQRYIYTLAANPRYIGLNFQIKLVEAEENIELARLYAECALFVFPSKLEGLGLPLIEALTFNAPILSSNAASLSEIIDNAEALFSPYDENELSTKIQTYLTQPKKLEQLRTYSQNHQDKFTWKKIGQHALASLQELSSKKHKKEHLPDPDFSSLTLPESITYDYLLAKAKQNNRTIYLDITNYYKTNDKSKIISLTESIIKYLPTELSDFNFELVLIVQNNENIYEIIERDNSSWKILGEAKPVINDYYISIRSITDLAPYNSAILSKWKDIGIKLLYYFYSDTKTDFQSYSSIQENINTNQIQFDFLIKNADSIIINSDDTFDILKKNHLKPNKIDTSGVVFISKASVPDSFNHQHITTQNKISLTNQITETLNWKESVHQIAIQIVELSQTKFFSYIKNSTNKTVSVSVNQLVNFKKNHSTENISQIKKPHQEITNTTTNQSNLIVRKYSKFNRYKFRILSKLHPSKEHRQHYLDKLNEIPMPKLSTRNLTSTRCLKYAFGACFGLTKEKRTHYFNKIKQSIK